jgi:tRNA(Ile)-lysidine synthase
MSWFRNSPDPATDDPFARACVRRSSAGILPSDARVTVAFSGGVDSTYCSPRSRGCSSSRRCARVHVDHGLHAESAGWAGAMRGRRGRARRAVRRGVRVTVARDSGSVSRRPRARRVTPRPNDSWRRVSCSTRLITADDQLETLLLRLMRRHGRARTPRQCSSTCRFGVGRLAGLCIGFTRTEIVAERVHRVCVARRPANDDPAMTGASAARRRACARRALVRGGAQRAAPRGANDGRRGDPRRVSPSATRSRSRSRPAIPLAVLAALEPARQRNLLRHLLRRVSLGPRARRKRGVAQRAAPRASGAQTRILWAGGEGRVFREHLYLMERAAARPRRPPTARASDENHGWSGPEGELGLEPAASGPGPSRVVARRRFWLRFRAGGEDFLGPSTARTATRSSVGFHDAGVVPWMRSAYPASLPRRPPRRRPPTSG